MIVTGLSDGVRDGDITYTLTAKAQPGGGYAGTESTSISITNQDHNKSDLYLLLDTSTSMLHSGGRGHRKIQSLLALEAFSNDAERAGYQFQRRSTGDTISSTQLLQKLAKQSSSRAIKELDQYTIIDNPNDGKNAENLETHLITYDYHVQHNSFILSRSKPSTGIDTMQSILSLKMADEGFGNSIKNNSHLKALGLPKPNRHDRYRGNKHTPSNLYAGTELLGALEGLDYLLTNKANDTNRRDQSTSVALVLHGRPERRSWWDTRTNSASDSSPAMPFRFPKASAKKTSPPQASSTTTKATRTFSKTIKANGSGRRCKPISMRPSIAWLLTPQIPPPRFKSTPTA